MDHTIYIPKLIKKITVYTSAALIFTAAPSLSVSAAETASQSESSSIPAETPGSSPSNTESLPAQTNTQTPADSASVTPETPSDTITVTPLPEPAPADQNTFDVTPMQGTVYASSQKGLNVRSGPSTTHSKLGTLKYGQEITITGKTADNWYQVQYSGGIGYVNGDFVSTTPPADTQNPVVQPPAVEDPVPENPDTGTEQVPSVDEIDTETGSEPRTEDDSPDEGHTTVVSSLIGTPVFIVLAAAIVGVLALIGFSVYGLFKKDDDTSEADDEEDYYEDMQYSDEDYHEDNETYFEEDYEGGQYPDEDYHEDNEAYPDGEYYEDNEIYPDGEYYEDNETYSGNEYYENNSKRR